MKKLFTLAAGLLAVFGTAAAQSQEEDLDLTYGKELIKAGEPAPEFSLPGLDGKTYTLADFVGKTLIIDFWATWCPDCREEMPQLKEFYSRLKGREDVIFIGISYDTDKQRLIDYVKDNGVGWLQLFEGGRMKDSATAGPYHIKWIPTKYVIGPDGKVVLATVVPEKVFALFSDQQ